MVEMERARDEAMTALEAKQMAAQAQIAAQTVEVEKMREAVARTEAQLDEARRERDEALERLESWAQTRRSDEKGLPVGARDRDAADLHGEMTVLRVSLEAAEVRIAELEEEAARQRRHGQDVDEHGVAREDAVIVSEADEPDDDDVSSSSEDVKKWSRARLLEAYQDFEMEVAGLKRMRDRLYEQLDEKEEEIDRLANQASTLTVQVAKLTQGQSGTTTFTTSTTTCSAGPTDAVEPATLKKAADLGPPSTLSSPPTPAPITPRSMSMALGATGDTIAADKAAAAAVLRAREAERKCTEMEQRVQDLSLEVEQARAEVSRAQHGERIAREEAQVALQRAQAAADLDHREGEAERQTLQSEVDQLRATLAREVGRREATQRMLDVLQHDRSPPEGDNEISSSSSPHSSPTSPREIDLELRLELRRVQAACAASEEQCRAVAEELHVTQAELAQVQAQRSAAESHAEDIQRQHAAIAGTLREVEAQLALVQAREEAGAARATRATAEGEILTGRREEEKKEEERKATEEAEDKLLHIVATLEAEVTAWSRKESEWVRREQDISRRAAEAEAAQEATEAALLETQRELVDARANDAETQRAFRDAQMSLQDARAQARTAEESARHSQSALATLAEDLARTRAELVAIRDTNSSSHLQVVTMGSARDALAADLLSTQQELERAFIARNEVARDLENSRVALRATRGELMVATSDLEQTRAKVDHLQADLREIQERERTRVEAERRREEVTKREAEAEVDRRRRHTQESEEWASERLTMERERDELRTEVAEQVAEVLALRARKEVLEGRLEESQKQASENAVQIRTWRVKHEDASRDVEKLRAEIVTHQDALTRAEASSTQEREQHLMTVREIQETARQHETDLVRQREDWKRQSEQQLTDISDLQSKLVAVLADLERCTREASQREEAWNRERVSQSRISDQLRADLAQALEETKKMDDLRQRELAAAEKAAAAILAKERRAHTGEVAEGERRVTEPWRARVAKLEVDLAAATKARSEAIKGRDEARRRVVEAQRATVRAEKAAAEARNDAAMLRRAWEEEVRDEHHVDEETGQTGKSAPRLIRGLISRDVNDDGDGERHMQNRLIRSEASSSVEMATQTVVVMGVDLDVVVDEEQGDGDGDGKELGDKDDAVGGDTAVEKHEPSASGSGSQVRVGYGYGQVSLSDRLAAREGQILVLRAEVEEARAHARLLRRELVARPPGVAEPPRDHQTRSRSQMQSAWVDNGDNDGDEVPSPDLDQPHSLVTLPGPLSLATAIDLLSSEGPSGPPPPDSPAGRAAAVTVAALKESVGVVRKSASPDNISNTPSGARLSHRASSIPIPTPTVSGRSRPAVTPTTRPRYDLHHDARSLGLALLSAREQVWLGKTPLKAEDEFRLALPAIAALSQPDLKTSLSHVVTGQPRTQIVLSTLWLLLTPEDVTDSEVEKGLYVIGKPSPPPPTTTTIIASAPAPAPARAGASTGGHDDRGMMTTATPPVRSARSEALATRRRRTNSAYTALREQGPELIRRLAWMMSEGPPNRSRVALIKIGDSLRNVAAEETRRRLKLRYEPPPNPVENLSRVLVAMSAAEKYRWEAEEAARTHALVEAQREPELRGLCSDPEGETSVRLACGSVVATREDLEAWEGKGSPLVAKKYQPLRSNPNLIRVDRVRYRVDDQLDVDEPHPSKWVPIPEKL